MGDKVQRLGDILLQMGAVDELQLKAAMAHQEQWGVKLGKSLVELRFCSEEDVLRALQLQAALPLVDLDATELNPKLAFTVSVKTAERLRVVPLRLEGKRHEILVFATCAPVTVEKLDAMRSVSGKAKVVPQLASDDAIERALGFLYYGRARQPPTPAVVPMREVRIESEETFELQSNEAVAPPPPPRADADASTMDAIDALLGVSPRNEAVPAKAAPSVVLFGWNDARARALGTMLKLAAIESRPVGIDAVDEWREGDVVIASTLSLQTVLPAGEKVTRGHVIICGLTQDLDMKDAKAVGARMYLRPPFSPEQLAKAIQHVLSRA